MDFYKIQWKQSAKKELKKLDKKVIPRILDAVSSLTEDPHPKGHKKLQGAEHTYRLRVGDYRVVYSVRSKILTIEIIRVRHRKDVYSKLI
ncbi:type II toxin-antitoxin system RelE/ParE family toxin [Okeania sp. SIO2G5]|uniref:type II toxin-antitoxin system RelE family toxin n=1 Tax=Okeania sp. SIO2G5 TaxID=2607796 RepID=UPI0013C114B1|nr:type II toxin-antitoxin system RelE/ParE family toxin [Okeania sp. SIO2G5]NEP76510.1 type II toxin-antitoxin system RelE/ParE family toxin [Okeania sp. SIO2G5]